MSLNRNIACATSTRLWNLVLGNPHASIDLHRAKHHTLSGNTDQIAGCFDRTAFCVDMFSKVVRFKRSRPLHT